VPRAKMKLARANPLYRWTDTQLACAQEKDASSSKTERGGRPDTRGKTDDAARATLLLQQILQGRKTGRAQKTDDAAIATLHNSASESA
jgi:hypothetical protein